MPSRLVLKKHDVVLGHQGLFSLFVVQAELVTGPGGFSGGGQPEEKDAVGLELAVEIPRRDDLCAGMQAQHALSVGRPHGLPEESLFVLAHVVRAQGDVEVVFRDAPEPAGAGDVPRGCGSW